MSTTTETDNGAVQYDPAVHGIDRLGKGGWPAVYWPAWGHDDRGETGWGFDLSDLNTKNAAAIQIHDAGYDYSGNPRRVTTLHVAGYGLVAAHDDGYRGEPTMVRQSYDAAWSGRVVKLPAADCSVREWQWWTEAQWVDHPHHGASYCTRDTFATGLNNSYRPVGVVDTLHAYRVNVNAVKVSRRRKYHMGVWARSPRGVWTYTRD